MPSCVVEIHKSPIESRKFCKIQLKGFDIPYDEVSKLTREYNIGFETEDLDGSAAIKMKNRYYYSQTKESKLPCIEIVLTNTFFAKGVAHDYSDVEELFEPDSTLPLLYTRCQSNIFSKIMSLLCRVQVREIKCL